METDFNLPPGVRQRDLEGDSEEESDDNLKPDDLDRRAEPEP